MNDYVMNMETHKLELHFEKEDYLALPEDLKKEINSNFFFQREIQHMGEPGQIPESPAG